MRGRRALVIQHEQPTPGGHLGRWLVERGVEQDVFRIDLEDREPDPADYDLVVSLGSEHAAYERLPWIVREEALLGRARREDIPILGICFGGQLLARVLGGECRRGDRSEVGWSTVSTHDESIVARGPWFQWHFDVFTVPPGAELLAQSDAGPQAYLLGRCVGTQFHPEVTPEIVGGWISVYAAELERENVDPAALVRETDMRAAAAERAAWRFFDAFAGRVGLGFGDVGSA